MESHWLIWGCVLKGERNVGALLWEWKCWQAPFYSYLADLVLGGAIADSLLLPLLALPQHCPVGLPWQIPLQRGSHLLIPSWQGLAPYQSNSCLDEGSSVHQCPPNSCGCVLLPAGLGTIPTHQHACRSHSQATMGQNRAHTEDAP